MAWLSDRLEISRAGAGVNNVRAMEGLRGLAVFLVFLVHFMTLVEPWIQADDGLLMGVRAVHSLGNVGVDLFFVLSGYLIYGALMARRQSLGRFWVRRVWRIYPVFVVMLALYLLLSWLFPAESKLPEAWGERAIYVLQNLLLLPGLFPIEPIITVAWSLSYEWFYYLLVPLLVEGGRLRERSRKERVATLAFLTAIASLAFGFFGGPVRLLMFASGMALWEAMSARHFWQPSSAVGLAAGLSSLLLALLPLPGAALQPLKFLLLGALFFTLCLAAFQTGRSSLAAGLTWTPLRWLGNMSYSYYLIHGLALKASFMLLGQLLPANGEQPMVLLLGLPLFFAASLVPGFLLFHFIERPYSLDATLPKRDLPNVASA
ncbi:MAG: acyltransferase [Burkholderiales bacterium]|nr:acyltransferase [Burkholderiales bacterium]